MRFKGQTHIDAVLSEVGRPQARGEDLGPLFEALANKLYTLAEVALEHEQDPRRRVPRLCGDEPR